MVSRVESISSRVRDKLPFYATDGASVHVTSIHSIEIAQRFEIEKERAEQSEKKRATNVFRTVVLAHAAESSPTYSVYSPRK